MLSRLFSFVTGRGKGKRQNRPASSQHFLRTRAVQLRLEHLEDRTVPSTFTVALSGDTGAGSGTSGDIRYCITQADQVANAGSTINFSVSSIVLSHGELPISQSMTLNGPGPTDLTISGNATSRVFDITAQNGRCPFPT